jgi:hypothetical protein
MTPSKDHHTTGRELHPPAHYYKNPEKILHQRATRGMLPASQRQKSMHSLYAHSAFARDRRRKRLSRKIRVQIRENDRRRCGARLWCASGDVRRDHHAVELLKLRKLRGYVRFALDHIQACPHNALQSQRIDQGRCIDNRPASDVDDIAFRPERREHVRVDEISRPRAAWRGADQEIGPRGQRDEIVEISIGRSGDGLPVVIADLHVKTARGAVRDPVADCSKTENAQTLAGNGRGVDTPLLLPSTGAHEAIGLKQVPGLAINSIMAESATAEAFVSGQWATAMPRARALSRSTAS